jgi:beta propeller repeat protein
MSTQIFLYDLKAETNPLIFLTNAPDSLDSHSLQVSGSNVVWQANDGNESNSDIYNIYLYDASRQTTTQLTSNDYTRSSFQVLDNYVVWQANDGEIYLYDVSRQTTTQITNNDYPDYGPTVFGDYVVWLGDKENDNEYDNDNQIYLYDINRQTTIQITDSNHINYGLQNSGDFLTWQAYDGNDDEIYLYDVSRQTTTQITDNSYQDTSPKISSNNIVWASNEGNDNSEIYFYDGSTQRITQLTNNNYIDTSPQISGNYVTWVSRDNISGSNEIYLYDISTNKTSKLTNDSNSYYWDWSERTSPKIAGNSVVWITSEAHDVDIYNIDTKLITQPANHQLWHNIRFFGRYPYLDYDLEVLGNNIVWRGFDRQEDGTSDTDIYCHDAITGKTINLSEPDGVEDWVDDSHPQIDGDKVVWLRGLNEFDVSPLQDVDYIYPSWENNNIIAENAPNDSTVGITAFARDDDGPPNNTVTYSLTDDAGGRFKINAQTGVVTVADGPLLDFETATSHSITVQALSTDGSTSSRSFIIAVTDVDELIIHASEQNSLGTVIFELIDTYQVKPEDSALQQTNAYFHNIIGLYEVVNMNGAVKAQTDITGDGVVNNDDILNPGDTGYMKSALNNRVNNFALELGALGDASKNTDSAEFGDVLLQGGKFYAPFIIANGGDLIPLNGSIQEGIVSFLAQNPNNMGATAENFMTYEVAYFSFGQANPDGTEHLKNLGNNTFGFEDLPGDVGVSDLDFNDGVFKFNFNTL